MSVRLFQEGAATPAQLEVAAKAVQTADAAFAKARIAVGALSDGAVIVQGLNQAAAKLAEVRTASDRAMGLPMSARDQAAIKGFLPGIAAVVGILEPLLNRLENQVAMADASLTALLNVARTSQDLRISAGGRAATVSLAISTRRPLTAAEISSMDRAQGRVDLDRERIEAGVDQIGSPPRLAKAMNDAIEAYFGKAAPWLEKEMAAGRNDGKYAIGSDQLASTIVPAVQAFFAVRDAALAEAGERAGAARDGALTMLALAGLAVVALLGVLAGVTVMLRRRVITPLATLTGAVGDLAAGRHDVTIPTVGRADEIGAMAGSLQVFKDALDRQEGCRRGRGRGSGCKNPARPARRPDHWRFRGDDRRDRRDRVTGLDRAGSLRRHADGDRGAFGGACHHGCGGVRGSLHQCAIGRIRHRRDGVLGQRDQPAGPGLGADRR